MLSKVYNGQLMLKILVVRSVVEPSLYTRPPNTTALRTGQKRRYWKIAVNEFIYNQKNHIRDWKIIGGMGESTEGRYWGI